MADYLLLANSFVDGQPITEYGSELGYFLDDLGFSFCGVYNKGIYVCVGKYNWLVAGRANIYSMYRSADGGRTWVPQDDANAPDGHRYKSLSSCMVGSKIVITLTVAGAGPDPVGIESSYYAIKSFDCETNTWGPTVVGPRRVHGDYFWDGADNEFHWSPRVSIASNLDGSDFRVTYTYREWDWGAGDWGPMLGRWAQCNLSGWGSIDNMLGMHLEGRNKAIGVIRSNRSAAFECFSMGWGAGGDTEITNLYQNNMGDPGHGSGLWQLAGQVEDQFKDWFETTYGPLVGIPIVYIDGAGVERYAIPFWKSTGAKQMGCMGVLRWTPIIVGWSLEEISSIPPCDELAASASACVYAAAGKIIGIVYDRQDAALALNTIKDIRYMPFVAEKEGLYTFWVRSTRTASPEGQTGTLYWSVDDGSGWSPAQVLIPAEQNVRNIDVRISTKGRTMTNWAE